MAFSRLAWCVVRLFVRINIPCIDLAQPVHLLWVPGKMGGKSEDRGGGVVGYGGARYDGLGLDVSAFMTIREDKGVKSGRE